MTTYQEISNSVDNLFSGYVDDLKKEVKDLSGYQISFGINDEDANVMIPVEIMNTDGTRSKTMLSLEEIVYFTEKGTIMIPGRNLLERFVNSNNERLQNEFNNITQQFVNGDVNKDGVLSSLNNLAFNLENELQAQYISANANETTLADILGEEVEQNYIFDLKKLAPYLHCKIVKKLT